MAEAGIKRFEGTVGVMQRALASYRVPVFEELALRCRAVELFAGRARASEQMRLVDRVPGATCTAAGNLHLLGGPLYLCWQRGVAAWLRRADPDVLIADANPRFLSTRTARRWMQRRGRPVIGWGLGLMPVQGAFERLRSAGRRRFVRGFDGMLAYSSRAAEQYEAMGMPRERIFIARNACTRRPTGPPPERPETYDGRPRVLFVGRLIPGKRLGVLFRAAARLPEHLRPRIVVVGDGPERARYEAEAARAYPHVEFVGQHHGAAAAPYFAAADLFVLPGLGGLAVQEAMAHGLPVIVADGDGTQADLVSAGTGWTVRPGDEEALAERLREALDDPVQLRSMGRRSFRLVDEQVNIEAMVDVFVEAAQTLARR